MLAPIFQDQTLGRPVARVSNISGRFSIFASMGGHECLPSLFVYGHDARADVTATK